MKKRTCARAAAPPAALLAALCASACEVTPGRLVIGEDCFRLAVIRNARIPTTDGSVTYKLGATLIDCRTGRDLPAEKGGE